MTDQHKENRAQKIWESKPYEKAKSKAEKYINSPERLKKLVGEATEKAKKQKGPLNEGWDSLMACIRLVKAYANGSYRTIPWQSILMIVAAVIYFVMPIDLIPDFIIGAGLLDDVSLLGWTIKTLSQDIQTFMQWEEQSSIEESLGAPQV